MLFLLLLCCVCCSTRYTLALENSNLPSALSLRMGHTGCCCVCKKGKGQRDHKFKGLRITLLFFQERTVGFLKTPLLL